MSEKDLELRKEMIATCLRLQELGYVIGTYGNVSVRVERGLLITPSRVDYHNLAPGDLVTVSLEGAVVEGTRLPSSELQVHLQIYCRRPDVGAVIHTHPLYATALSCLHRTIPVFVEEQSQVIGGPICCTEYIPAGQHKQLGEQVAQVLGESAAVLLANHGAVGCGKNVAEAMFTCQIVERVAQMYFLTSSAGHAILIPPEHVAGERERWLFKYGRPEDRAAE